jgi:hypothetical protein
VNRRLLAVATDTLCFTVERRRMSFGTSAAHSAMAS